MLTEMFLYFKFQLVALFLLHSMAATFILRLPCKYEGHFSIKVHATKLINSLIARHTVKNVHECYEKCKANPGCRSINHRDFGDNNCHLSNKIKEEMISKNVVLEDFWTYYATDYNKSNIGSYCQAFQPCLPTEVCIDTCYCPGYKCMSRCDLKYYEGQSYAQNLTNIALRKPVTTSSIYDRSTKPENAVDGNLHSSHSTCSLTRRNREQRSWLRVNLQAKYFVVYVQLKSRESVIAVTRSQPFDVFVGSRRFKQKHTCFQQCQFEAANILKRFYCPPGTKGRFASFFTGYDTYLDICEFEVYGYR